MRFVGVVLSLITAYQIWGSKGVLFTLGLLMANGTVYFSYKGTKI